MIRLIDILLSATALLVLVPVLVPIAFLLAFTGEGEIFFLQERVGKGGKHFNLYKFATMLRDSPNIGSKEITVASDPRVLPVGSVLRKTKINELPQLLNIFLGDISVVGPRPMVPSTFSRYPSGDKELISTVKPGLTGIGSIVFRDEERFLEGQEDPQGFYNRVIIPYKSELEVWSINAMSLALYFKVILATALAILLPRVDWSIKFFKDLPSKPPELV